MSSTRKATAAGQGAPPPAAGKEARGVPSRIVRALNASGNLAARLHTGHPGRSALVHLPADGSPAIRLSYGEFLTAVLTLSADLRQEVGGGRRIGLIGVNEPGWLVTFYALQLAGATPVPVSHKLPPAALRHVVADAGLAEVFLGASQRDRAGDLGIPSRPLPRVAEILERAGDIAEPDIAEPDIAEPGPQDLAMVLYTSGSTGYPKGVPLTHRSHRWVLDQVAAPAREEFRVVVAAPLFHMNALARTQKALASGETVLLLEQFDPGRYVDAITGEGAHELSGVPPMFALLAPMAAAVPESARDGVVHVNMASAPAGEALYADMSRLFPRARVTLGYGTTESGPVAFWAPPEVEVPIGSVGVRHPAVDVRIVDPVTRRPTEGTGVLQIRTGAMFHGYLGVDETPITEDGYYHTKDLVRREGDFFFVTGREDSVFSSGGENVYPSSVEAVLRSHPDVREAVVVPVPDEVKAWKPVAFVTVAEGSRAAETELRAHALRHLEPYAHPRRVWIIEDMPLTGPHKIDTAELARRARELLDSDPRSADAVPGVVSAVAPEVRPGPATTSPEDGRVPG